MRYTQVGTFETKLRVDDAHNDDECKTKVTVAASPPANQAPTANAGPDQTVTLAAGQTTIAVTLNGSGSTDPDGTIATYNWTGTPNPSRHGQPHRHPGRQAPTPSPWWSPTTSGASSAADTVIVTVNPAPPVNQAPTANAGPDQTVTLAAGQTTIAVTLNGSGSSRPGRHHRQLQLDRLPESGATRSAPPSPWRRAAYTFTLVVTDNDGASSAADTVTITVNPAPPVNQAPTANAGPDQTVTIAAGQTSIAVTLERQRLVATRTAPSRPTTGPAPRIRPTRSARP